jgi:hypothetical protein
MQVKQIKGEATRPVDGSLTGTARTSADASKLLAQEHWRKLNLDLDYVVLKLYPGESMP